MKHPAAKGFEMTMRNQRSLEAKVDSSINQSLWGSGSQTLLSGNNLAREKNIQVLHTATENIKN
jgi:hypothetical protein